MALGWEAFGILLCSACILGLGHPGQSPSICIRTWFLSIACPLFQVNTLRFREVNPEITLLGRKQHWGRSWKAFLEITTLFDFLLHVLKFAGAGQQQREEMIFAAKASFQFMHQETTDASLQFCQPLCSQRWLLRENTGKSAFQKTA